MTTSPGSSLRKPFSRPTESAARDIVVGLAICLAFGIVLALSDIYLRLPLHMPGWRGFIGMGLLVLARQLSGQVWGATCCALAAALASAYGADTIKFGPFAYLVSGLVIDLCLARPAWRDSALLVGLAAGLGNLGKFAIAVLATVLFGPKAFGHGLVFAALGHLAFGFLGGLLVARIRRHDPAKAGRETTTP